MIALNEIVNNKKFYEDRYKLANKSVNLDKILSLENKFILIDKKANELRSTCNKLCSQVAETINSGVSPAEQIKQINKLDKQIEFYNKKSACSMKKINKALSKLPNLSMDTNILNLPLPTHENSEFGKEQFIENLTQSFITKQSQVKPKCYLKSIKNQVFKAEELALNIMFKNKKTELLMFSKTKQDFESVINTLKNNAKYLIDKSIKYLKKESSKEFLAVLCDNTRLEIQFTGEYVSRGNNLKFYSKELDMTKFVNITKITIK